VLYPCITNLGTLRLDAFRGEPAITERDWLFTAIPTSSDGFATPNRSRLPTVLTAVHTGQG